MIRGRRYDGTAMFRLRAQVCKPRGNQEVASCRWMQLFENRSRRMKQSWPAPAGRDHNGDQNWFGDGRRLYESPKETIRTDQMAEHTPKAQRRRHATTRVCGIARRQARELARGATGRSCCRDRSTDNECDREGCR